MRKLNSEEQIFIDRLFEEMYRTLLIAAKVDFGNKDLAEEAVQETFRVACNRIDKIKASPNPAGWLMLTLKNNIYNIKRGRARLTNLILQAADVEDLADTLSYNMELDNPDILYADIADTEEYKLIKKVVLEKREMADIAEEYGITLVNCRQKIHRAKIKLQQKIKEK